MDALIAHERVDPNYANGVEAGNCWLDKHHDDEGIGEKTICKKWQH